MLAVEVTVVDPDFDILVLRVTLALVEADEDRVVVLVMLPVVENVRETEVLWLLLTVLVCVVDGDVFSQVKFPAMRSLIISFTGKILSSHPTSVSITTDRPKLDA